MPKERRYKKASSRIAKREKVRKTVALALKIGVPLAFFVGLIFVFRADFLQIKDVKVTGGEYYLEENIKNTVLSFSSGSSFLLIPKSNILLLNKDKLANSLLSKFGRIENVDIDKNLFGKNIKISLEERKSDFLWCKGINECFFMDKSGLVFEKVDESLPDSAQAIQGKIIFKGSLTGDPIMKNFVTPEKMQNYIKFIETLGDAGLKVSSINIESSEKGIASANSGDIIFSPEEANLSVVAQNIILLMNEIKAKNPSARFNYIDARFGNKIFYKLY